MVSLSPPRNPKILSLKGDQKDSKSISKKPAENLVKGGRGVVTNVTGGGKGPHGGGVKRKLHPDYTGVAI